MGQDHAGDGLRLYIGEKNISSWSMRAFVMLHAKRLRFEERTLSLIGDADRSRRRAYSPTGRLPVLHLRGRVVPDSLAILEYLEETFPAPGHPALWPADPGQRAHARWLAAAMHSGFAQVRAAMSFHRCFLERRPDVPADARAEAAEILAYWEAALADSGGPFLFGPFGGVDAMYAPVVVRLRAFEITAAGRTADYLDAVLAHAAVREWMDPARALAPAPDLY